MNSGPLTRQLSPAGCEPLLPGWRGVCRQGPWGWTSFPGPFFHPDRGGTVSWLGHWSSGRRGARGNNLISHYILHKCCGVMCLANPFEFYFLCSIIFFFIMISSRNKDVSADLQFSSPFNKDAFVYVDHVDRYSDIVSRFKWKWSKPEAR